MDMLSYFLGRLAEGGTGGSGSGTEYTSIVYNTDNTVTLTDKDGVIHTMSCSYADGKLIGATYDGKPVDLTYNGDVLVKVGKTSVDVANVPATSGATFNIAYGETAPEDTSKLWVRANEPTNVELTPRVDGVNSLSLMSAVLPQGLSRIRTATIGDKIYVFGGYNTQSLNTIYCYDTETDTIETLSTTLPSVLDGMGTATIGNKVYLFGGWSNDTRTSDIRCFDSVTGNIETISSLPTFLRDMGTATVGNKIYLFGGTESSSSSKYKNTIYCFNAETNTIQTLPITLPVYGLCGMGTATIGNKVYLFGGYGKPSASSNANPLNVIYCYDTETDTIETLSTTLPSVLRNMGTATIGNKVYLFGGYAWSACNAIYCFDAESNTIETLSTTLLTGLEGNRAEVIGNKVYIFGGSSQNTIYCFTVTFPLTNGDILINQQLSANLFEIIKSDNIKAIIGVKNVYIGNANNEAELCEAYLYNGTEWVVIK